MSNERSTMLLRRSRIAELFVALAVVLASGSAASAQSAPASDSLGLQCREDAPAVQRQETQPLTITFFGVSTLMFNDQRDRILVDGFFSRPGPVRTFVGAVAPIRSRVEGGLGLGPPRVRALLVAHAHHDHALDIGTVAQLEPGAFLVGTPSVLALAEAQGVGLERRCAGSAGRRFNVGGYTIDAIDAPHGPPLPLIGPLIDRPLERPPIGPAHFTKFTDDENLSFFITHGQTRRILVHPSAGTQDMTSYRADIVFLGMGRVGTLNDQKADAYFASVIGDRATLVVPIHWDAFTTPLDQPLSPTPWPIDDVAAGFDHLCRYAARRPGLEIMKPAMRSRLVIQASGAWRTEGEWAPLCSGGRYLASS